MAETNVITSCSACRTIRSLDFPSPSWPRHQAARDRVRRGARRCRLAVRRALRGGRTGTQVGVAAPPAGAGQPGRLRPRVAGCGIPARPPPGQASLPAPPGELAVLAVRVLPEVRTREQALRHVSVNGDRRVDEHHGLAVGIPQQHTLRPLQPDSGRQPRCHPRDHRAGEIPELVQQAKSASASLPIISCLLLLTVTDMPGGAGVPVRG